MIPKQENLNKENFWNNCMAIYPDATKFFCEWIDNYKMLVAWELFIPEAKFHDLSIELQTGIWIGFIRWRRGGCEYKVDLFEYDLEEDILNYMCALQGEITEAAKDDKPEPCPQELRCHTRNHPAGTCDCHNMGILPAEQDRWPPAKGMENKPLDTTGKWFNVQCQKCGWTGSSEFLDGGGQIADTGDYGDTYCPNCGQIDPDDYTPEQEAGKK